jgi:CubicO group peptidase (beta-lactamase class C family)
VDNCLGAIILLGTLLQEAVMRGLQALITVALVLFGVVPVVASGLPAAKPEEVGLSTSRLERIGQVLKADVERERIAGAVVMVARKGRLAYLESVGYRDKAAGARMMPDAIFRIASMTKPLVSVAAMSLHEEGRLLVSDPVSKYFPSFAKLQVSAETAPGGAESTGVPPQRPMTIQDLLRHTSGLTYGNRGTSRVHQMYPQSSNVASQQLTGEEFIDRLSQVMLLSHPGTRWEYSLSTDVLGRVVEVVSGKPLAEFLAERIYGPLKMPDTSFLVSADKRERIAQPLSKHPDTGAVVTLPDPTVRRKFDCGGGCAVSTAGDYLRFAQMLLNRGTLDGTRVLSRKTVEYMTSDHLGTAISRGNAYIAGPGYTWGLGFAVRQTDGIAGSNGSAGDYFWPGAFGTSFWVDPKEEIVVVYMMQAGAGMGGHYRDLLRGLVLQAIE